jgi:redox-sensitive bicupin YhaK (pirin superfamily)
LRRWVNINLLPKRAHQSATLHLAPQRYAYVHVARGSVELNGLLLQEGDGLRAARNRR